ncbi:NAD-dependent deacylase [Fulvivirga sp. M361]|uniref:SIR2 family NAD-dependent protein deacylase n=1 Tax=Fulvivirga sp. M361 TaxID=2594266 RepID=UPI00117B992E|nr:NAD-dependent deacylase [Fulvivirga sp. M361]TRX52642.1 NAD-dependent deacylase [Fulvivirga sp. M361]
MKKIAVLTGAGVSAESGIATFRDADGLWEGHDVMEVASPEGWRRNPELVLEFYNQRRKAALNAKPNKAHIGLAELEDHFDVTIITQNVDELHEQAGSSNVIHLHGKLFESRSTADPSLIYSMDSWQLNIGDLCEKGSQLRPNIVWFGEMVPMIEVAAQLVSGCDFFVVAGTSLLVYPAASLIDYVAPEISKYLIDPKIPDMGHYTNLTLIEDKATSGVEKLKTALIQQK